MEGWPSTMEQRQPLAAEGQSLSNAACNRVRPTWPDKAPHPHALSEPVSRAGAVRMRALPLGGPKGEKPG